MRQIKICFLFYYIKDININKKHIFIYRIFIYINNNKKCDN